jgi:hypothetical protein
VPVWSTIVPHGSGEVPGWSPERMIVWYPIVCAVPSTVAVSEARTRRLSASVVGALTAVNEIPLALLVLLSLLLSLPPLHAARLAAMAETTTSARALLLNGIAILI